MEINLIFFSIFLFIIFVLLFFRIDYLIYFFCITCVIIQWFYGIKILIFSGVDILAISFPFALLVKFIITKKNSILAELNKDETIILFYFLLLSLFTCGLLPLYVKNYGVIKTFYDIITDWAKFSTYFVIFLVFSGYVLNRKSVEKLFFIFPFSIFLPGVYFLWQLITNQLITLGGRLIPTAGFYNPHFITYDIIMLLPLVIFNIYNTKVKSSKIVWIVFFMIMLIIALFSYARTGWFGILTELFIAGLLIDNKKKKFLIFSSVLMLLPILFSLGYLNPIISKLNDISYFIDHINEVWDSQSEKITRLFSGRWGIWRADLKAFLEGSFYELLLGRGMGAAGTIAAAAGIYAGEAHNTYIVLLIDFGIINFSLYFSIIILMFIKAIKFLKNSDLFLRNIGKLWICLLGGYSIVGIGTHLCYDIIANWIFWAICGVNIGVFAKKIS